MKKRVLAALILVTSIMTAAGCAGKEAPQAETQVQESSVEAQAEESTEEPVEETAEAEEKSEIEEVTETEETTESEDAEEAEEIQEETEAESEDDMTPAFKIVNDMTVGWNLGNTLDAYVDSFASDKDPKKHETSWGNPETTQDLMDAILATGVNTIRIPIMKTTISMLPGWTEYRKSWTMLMVEALM